MFCNLSLIFFVPQGTEIAVPRDGAGGLPSFVSRFGEHVLVAVLLSDNQSLWYHTHSAQDISYQWLTEVPFSFLSYTC
jgi:hypothetical protein